jgi:glycine/D-amino acid oxidase-like deaminating enzyme
MSQSYDVVIAGGAAMGSSTAYHLLRDPAFRGRVLVVEKDPTYGRSASALSAASIRQQFSSPVNIRISLYGIRFLRAIGEHLGVEGDRPEIGLSERGYLYCATAAGAPVLAENQALQAAEGADILLLDPDALRAASPGSTPRISRPAPGAAPARAGSTAGGCSRPSAEGARARGRVPAGRHRGVEREGSRVVAVRLADGSRIACGALVNCAGSGGPALAEMAGVPIPVRAKRRYVFTFTCRERIENCPLLIDTSGAWCRPEGEGFIGSASPGLGDEDPDWHDDDPATQEPTTPSSRSGSGRRSPTASPPSRRSGPGRAWAGPYDMCLLDHNAIVGQAGPDNFYLCNGFSGTACSNRPQSAGASRSSSCTAATRPSISPISASSGWRPAARSWSAT